MRIACPFNVLNVRMRLKITSFKSPPAPFKWLNMPPIRQAGTQTAENRRWRHSCALVCQTKGSPFIASSTHSLHKHCIASHNTQELLPDCACLRGLDRIRYIFWTTRANIRHDYGFRKRIRRKHSSPERLPRSVHI